MKDRRSRRAARIAWAASVGVHGVIFAGIWAIPSPTPPPEPDFDLTFTLTEPDDEPERTVALAPQTANTPNPSVPPRSPQPPTGRPPVVVPMPATLPANVAAFLRERADRPAPEPVREIVDVQHVAASTTAEPVAEVVQASTQAPVEPTHQRPTTSAGGKLLHGPIPQGQTVVYVLDCSGTMGLGGKLARAKASLLATIASQPAGVRVLVVTYSGRAVPLTEGGPVAVTDAVRERIAAALARLEPAGESRHADGVRVALKFDPDYVLVLTDADKSELAGLKAVAAGARRPVSLHISRAF